MDYDRENEMFDIAVELAAQSSRNIFLTGRAGTGKTTFLKYLKANSLKQMAVVAPTGVAAINAGGVTIHSFFQLPLSPYIPGGTGFMAATEESVSKHDLINRLKFDKEKLKVLRELELLVIDEISMVRCDIMDAIDTVLRHVRHEPSVAFGGVQVLLIGDMFQLPPVVRDNEWRILAEYYNSPYFFDSLVIRESAPLYIEFNKIYRQSEEQFIRVLNQVRHNELDEESAAILRSCYQPSITRHGQDGFITLTTHNESARRINAEQLDALDGRVYSYRAEVEGEFASNSFPAEEELKLKVGAQVMFIRNDSERIRRFYNGKIGIVTSLESDKIKVQCAGDDKEIEVKKEKWDNIRYAVNKKSSQLEEDHLGSFTQYPLRLAWAITIHKSQGLTFEKAIIDAGKSFASGQVYVALSRCTNLKGLVLQSEIRPGTILSDPRIVDFANRSSSSDTLREELVVARRHYQEKLLLSTFDFKATLRNAEDLKSLVFQHKPSFNHPSVSWVADFYKQVDNIQDLAMRFRNWLKNEFNQPISLEDNETLQDRLQKGAAHFVIELDRLIGTIEKCPVVSDSIIHAKAFNEDLRSAFTELTWKRFLLHRFERPFSTEYWQRTRKQFLLPPLSFNAYAAKSRVAADTPHPELFSQLKYLRDSLCQQHDLPVYMIASSHSLEDMVRYLPRTSAGLRKIKGFGDAKVKQHGADFLEIINDYCLANGLDSLIQDMEASEKKRGRSTPKATRRNTREETLKLFQGGMPVHLIAKARGLTASTVEGHLTSYILKGTIDINELLNSHKISLIQQAITAQPDSTLTALKQVLGPQASFSEIRMVQAWIDFRKADPGKHMTETSTRE